MTAPVPPETSARLAQPSPPASPGVRRLDSQALLGAAQQVEIVHGSQVYRLRLTSLGKLILTKWPRRFPRLPLPTASCRQPRRPLPSRLRRHRPRTGMHPNTDPDEHPFPPACAGGLLAGTLALMTTWAAPEPDARIDGGAQRALIARKLVSNLCFLRDHPDLGPGLRAVMGKLHERWAGIAQASNAAHWH